jgi:hypothetical protein
MGLIAGMWMALLGVLAAPGLLLSRQPLAKAALDKIVPYQGWIGAFSALWGAWGVVSMMLNLDLLRHFRIYWFTYMTTSLLQVALGLLLGVGVLKSFVRAPAAQSRLDSVIARLAPRQGKLGLFGVVLGAWLVVCGFVLHG